MKSGKFTEVPPKGSSHDQHQSDCVHLGQHDAIIDEMLWNEVQDGLATNRVERAV